MTGSGLTQLLHCGPAPVPKLSFSRLPSPVEPARTTSGFIATHQGGFSHWWFGLFQIWFSSLDRFRRFTFSLKNFCSIVFRFCRYSFWASCMRTFICRLKSLHYWFVRTSWRGFLKSRESHVFQLLLHLRLRHLELLDFPHPVLDGVEVRLPLPEQLLHLVDSECVIFNLGRSDRIIRWPKREAFDALIVRL